jgi:hypothetical protein
MKEFTTKGIATAAELKRVARLSRPAHPKRGCRVFLSVSEIPQKVIDSAERIGGYLGLDERYFDANGEETNVYNAKFLVVGNYYGAAIYAIEGAVRRLRGFE